MAPPPLSPCASVESVARPSASARQTSNLAAGSPYLSRKNASFLPSCRLLCGQVFLPRRQEGRKEVCLLLPYCQIRALVEIQMELSWSLGLKNLALCKSETTGVWLFIGSKVLCVFCFEICTPEVRGGEKGGSANFKTKRTEPFIQEITSIL